MYGETKSVRWTEECPIDMERHNCAEHSKRPVVGTVPARSRSLGGRDVQCKESFFSWQGRSVQGAVLEVAGTFNARSRSLGGRDVQCKESFLR